MLRLCVGEYCLRDTAVAGRPPSPSSLPIPLIEYPFEGARLRNVEYDMLLLAEPLLYADDGAIVEGHLGCESVEQLLLYYNVRRKSSLPIQTWLVWMSAEYTSCLSYSCDSFSAIVTVRMQSIMPSFFQEHLSFSKENFRDMATRILTQSKKRRTWTRVLPAVRASIKAQHTCSD